MNDHQLFLLSLQERQQTNEGLIKGLAKLAGKIPLPGISTVGRALSGDWKGAAISLIPGIGGAINTARDVASVAGSVARTAFGAGKRLVQGAAGHMTARPQPVGESMNYLDKVKKTVQNMKPDNSVIHQQVDQKANTGDRSKSIKVEEPFKAIKPKLFRNTSFNPKNVGSEGY